MSNQSLTRIYGRLLAMDYITQEMLDKLKLASQLNLTNVEALALERILVKIMGAYYTNKNKVSIKLDSLLIQRLESIRMKLNAH